MARYPVGATLLYDSVPAMEERETRMKATGFFRTLGPPEVKAAVVERSTAGAGAKLLLVDNDDCFIHTLANYARRSEEHTSELQSLRHLVCRLLLEKKKQNRRRHTGREL